MCIHIKYVIYKYVYITTCLRNNNLTVFDQTRACGQGHWIQYVILPHVFATTISQFSTKPVLVVNEPCWVLHVFPMACHKTWNREPAYWFNSQNRFHRMAGSAYCSHQQSEINALPIRSGQTFRHYIYIYIYIERVKRNVTSADIPIERFCKLNFVWDVHFFEKKCGAHRLKILSSSSAWWNRGIQFFRNYYFSDILDVESGMFKFMK